MLTFKVIGALLHYPSAELQANADELMDVIREEGLVRDECLDGFEALIRHIRDQELLEVQAAYVETFDRGRARSLHLFEHVHGESRDRGQAMVELQQVYRDNGFEIDVSELPDYLPLFLEFISTLPARDAVDWLEQMGHLMVLLHSRLAAEESPYAVLFEPLLELAGEDPHDEAVREQVAQEERDDTREALDKVWMEEPVTFGADSGDFGVRPNRRPQGVPSVEPVQWAPPRKASNS